MNSARPDQTVLPSPPSDPDRRARMPNLFVIGASKSGSSALHAYLRCHPDIAMSREKEPCFFVDQDELKAAWPVRARQKDSYDLDAYLDLWPGGETARYRGEGSVYYSQAPHRSGVPARIAAACPDARIIYTVREPVARAISHYWQRYKEFQERLPLDEAIETQPLYRDTSDYALQLGEYLAHFDRSQIHIVVAEELKLRRREVLADTLEWLGLAPYDFSEDEITERHVSPPTSRQERFPMVAAVRNSAAWAGARRYLPRAVVDRLRKSATVAFDKADVDETRARAYLAAYFEPRIPVFEALLGRTVPQWHRAAQTPGRK